MDLYLPSEIDPTLTQLAKQWSARIEQARQHKEFVFGANAREMMQYYSGPRSWDELMGKHNTDEEVWQDTQFKMHVNKAYEFVSLFGPALYYDNPVRTVKPRAPLQVPGNFFQNPVEFQAIAQQEQIRVAIDGMRSVLLEGYLNWTPHEFKLEKESRLAIDESLIKGRGLLWTELVQSPDGGQRSITSRWGSVDELLIDPDAPSLDKAKWIARSIVHPVWQVERDYGLRRGSLKGNLESMSIQGDILSDPDLQYDRKRGITNDLMRYYLVYSKMGIGARLPGMDPSWRGPLDDLFGDYCFLVIGPSVAFPLNLHPDLCNDPNRFQDVKRSAQWPIPLWAGRGDWWPCTALDFHSMFNSPWPMPCLLAAKGEMRFLNWVMSFLAGHIRNTTRDFIAIKKSLPEELKATLLGGKDLELIEIDHEHGLIGECVQFLQHPQANGDVWEFIEKVERNFDKRVGLNELLYGGSAGDTQPRSAAESNIKNESSQIRPEDMATVVERWQSDIAAKEAAAARYCLTSLDIYQPLGMMAASQWDTYVFTADMATAYHQLDYRIEAGSTRRPNKDFEVRQMTDALQNLAPILQTYAQTTGDLSPLNNLLADYARSRDLDANRYQLRMAPLAPLLPPSAPGNPTPEGNLSVPPASGQEVLG
jgi:hypothetical protein